MFIKKIIMIKNVGRFKEVSIKGGWYGPFTLIYGGNGHGKTTLCAILRSLQLNNPKLIQSRKNFNATSEPEIELLLDTGSVRFSDGAWTEIHPEIHIFDRQFVAENVHGGREVAVEHRRNFYRIVVGHEGVALAKEVDQLDADVTAKQSEITAQKKALNPYVPANMDLEKFLNLPMITDIDDKINDEEKALKAINDEDQIMKRDLLNVMSLPVLPNEFLYLLEKNVNGIAVAATTLVQAHLEDRFRDGGEGWLSQGLSYIVDNHCPFCAKPTEGNELINAYRGYFSEAYTTHTAAITDMKTKLIEALSSTSGLRVEQSFERAKADAEFWRTYVDHGYNNTSGAAGRISNDINALFEAASAMLRIKEVAPLKSVKPSADFIEAENAWLSTMAELQAEMAVIIKANDRIQSMKDTNTSINKSSAEEKLAYFRAVKKRHSEPALGLVLHYEILFREKDILVKTKEAKKTELDVYDKDIFGAYEADINLFLKSFGTSFRLAKTEKSYVGKAPQSTYSLRFGEKDIDITKSSDCSPSFDTTMSDGDKSTFALAFFLSQIKRDGGIANKIVVFDDPFTSLDKSRRSVTAKEIVRTVEENKAGQVILLSHSKSFLRIVYDIIREKTYITPLHILPNTDKSSIEPWNISYETKDGYLRDHLRLKDFAEKRSGNARDMLTIMRPLLEKYIRHRFPNVFPDKKWLGDMLASIRNDEFHPLKEQYKKLDDINAYTSKFHHDPDASFDEDEAWTYAQFTIEIIGGC